MIRTKRFSAAVLGLLLAATACQNDKLNRPFNFTPVDPLFERYVSLGNSITAGFQSNGINEITQPQSYAVLLARAMHSPFFSPLLAFPGCPAPYDSLWSRFGAPVPHRVNPQLPSGCALRKNQAVTPPFISNVAVPGARVIMSLIAGTARVPVYQFSPAVFVAACIYWTFWVTVGAALGPTFRRLAEPYIVYIVIGIPVVVITYFVYRHLRARRKWASNAPRT